MDRPAQPVRRQGPLADTLIEASHEIHEHPETNYEEHFAHDLLTGHARRRGLKVNRCAYGVDTAFEAQRAPRSDHAVLLEYDALPGIGHACGHNIIAAAGLGAGLAAAPLADEVGGRVAVLGTPAEEGAAARSSWSSGVPSTADAAMMVPPAGADLLA